MEQHGTTGADSLSDAKAHLDEFVHRAEAGESIDIVREGRLVARIVPVVEADISKERDADAKRPFEIEALRRHLSRMPLQQQDSGTFVRHLRDTDRY